MYPPIGIGELIPSIELRAGTKGCLDRRRARAPAGKQTLSWPWRVRPAHTARRSARAGHETMRRRRSRVSSSAWADH